MNKEQELRPCPFCGRSLVLLGRLIQKWEHPAETDADAACPGFRLWFNATPENVAAWNCRSSDEQAEVVGWAYERLTHLMIAGEDRWIKHLSETEPRPSDNIRNVRRLYASPPAVAAGGVTEALRSAMGMCEQYADFIRHVPAAEIEQHPYLPELEQVIEVARAALAVGDEGIREGEPNAG